MKMDWQLTNELREDFYKKYPETNINLIETLTIISKE